MTLRLPFVFPWNSPCSSPRGSLYGSAWRTLARSVVTALFTLVWISGTVQAQSDEPSDGALLFEHANEAWTGDLDGMLERGFVRILTTFNPLYFTYEGVSQQGLAVEIAREFEKHLKANHKKKGRPLNVVLIPVARDELFDKLRSGEGDIISANLTITAERQERVAFSDPTYPDVRELVITGPAAPDVATIDDLTAMEIHVRESSSYFEHLTALNRQRKKEGKAEIPLRRADEHLEDYDLLEMVNAGLIPAIIVDSHKAALWVQVFDEIRLHEDLAVNSGGEIAWALRKDNPQLLKTVNAFVKEVRKGTLLGNILIKRYLKSTKWIDNVMADDGRARYQDTIGFIKDYAGKYDFDWLMIAAQGYQESRLDQSKKSKAGAIGIMQILPTTAADPNVGIPDIHEAEPNVHAGVKYLRFLRERYFSESEIDPLNRVLFSFAAYNAGPANIAKARKKAAAMGFDKNQWFGHAEVAAARTISHEPVIYVRNIYKYYVAYRQLEELRQAKEAALEDQN